MERDRNESENTIFIIISFRNVVEQNGIVAKKKLEKNREKNAEKQK